ncbi:hypothetical protein [Halolamina pelagica]|uniref:hypothetical protein n=1 Tax=Halolamina pelagica TaxID=699431 RepID=UPI0011873AB2|nr:hypothetical protein [Halolamina pelagica]
MTSIDASLQEVEGSLGGVNDGLQEWEDNYFHYQKPRYRALLQMITERHTEGRILEIGAMPYHLTAALSNLEFPVTGIDHNPDRSDLIDEFDLDIRECDIEREEFPFKMMNLA